MPKSTAAMNEHFANLIATPPASNQLPSSVTDENQPVDVPINHVATMMKQTNTHLLHLTSHFHPALFSYSLPPMPIRPSMREEKKKPVINYSSLRRMLLEESFVAEKWRGTLMHRQDSARNMFHIQKTRFCIVFISAFIYPRFTSKVFSSRASSSLTLTNHKNPIAA